MTSFVTGVVAGLAIAMPPGAVTTLIVRTGLQRGFRAAFAAGSGTATVDGLYVIVAVVAGSAIVPFLGAANGPLRIVTGVALVVLGIAGMIRARGDAPAPPLETRRDLLATYLRFVAITLVNPATLAYFVAIALGFGGTILADAGAFVAGVFAASFTWHAVLALLSGSLHGRLGPRARLALAVVANTVIIALGARILLQPA